MNEPSRVTPQSRSMPGVGWSMEKPKKDTGLQTSSCSKSKRLPRLWTSNFQEMRAGKSYGYLTTAAATLRCPDDTLVVSKMNVNPGGK